MEDAATAEISRTQLWLWLKKEVVLENGIQVSKSIYETIIKEELENLRSSIKSDEKIIFIAMRSIMSADYAPPGFQGCSILFVFTNYGKLIRNNFREPGFLFYDSHNLLHPEAFEIMKKLWNRESREIPIYPHRYYAGNVSEAATQSKSGILSFFKNIVYISDSLREKDLKLYEKEIKIKHLEKEVEDCIRERIQDIKKSIDHIETYDLPQ